MDNSERIKILEDEVNKYLDKVEKVPLYPVDRYRLVYYCFEYLRTLGYKYDINSCHKLVIVNYYHEPDVLGNKEGIEKLYHELDGTISDMAIYKTDRQNILFQFRELIFNFGIKATYWLGKDVIEINDHQ